MTHFKLLACCPLRLLRLFWCWTSEVIFVTGSVTQGHAQVTHPNWHCGRRSLILLKPYLVYWCKPDLSNPSCSLSIAFKSLNNVLANMRTFSVTYPRTQWYTSSSYSCKLDDAGFHGIKASEGNAVLYFQHTRSNECHLLVHIPCRIALSHCHSCFLEVHTSKQWQRASSGENRVYNQSLRSQCLLVMQAHEEQVHHLQRDRSLQSGRLNSLEMEASDLRR